jgi:hypothetical protein
MLFPIPICDADTMMIKTKIKLRTCEICGIKKKVAEFPVGKICNKCESPVENAFDKVPLVKVKMSDDSSLLHAKIDLLTERLDRMETLMLGLMELVGKINYDMEVSKDASF